MRAGHVSAYWIPFIQKFWVGTFIAKDDPISIIVQIPLPIPALRSALNIHLYCSPMTQDHEG